MIHHRSHYVLMLAMGLAIASASSLSGIIVHAEGPSQAITVSPASTDIATDAGSSVHKTIDVINSGSDPFNIALSSAPYYVTGVAYDPHFTQLPGTVDASAWVHLSLTSSSISGNKTLTIPYTVDVPDGTPAGGYYAVIFAETSTSDQKTGVVSHNRVGNILYITVNGTIKTGGDLTGSPLASFSFARSIPITTKISNSGGTHFVTSAVDSVADFSGNKVFTATTDRYVLPQTEREISVNWSPQSLFGIFTIHRSATIAGNIHTLPDQKIVIINPWALVGATFVVGILIAAVIHRFRRRSSHQKK